MTAAAAESSPKQGHFRDGEICATRLDAAASGPCRANAYALGVLSDAAYGPLDANRLLDAAQQLDDRFREAVPVTCDNSQAVVFEHTACIVVVWRGSEGDEAVGSDWRDNLDYRRTEPATVLGRTVQFHKGFWDHVQRAWPHDGCVRAVLERMLSAQRRPVFFAGHSLGGAAALVAALRFLMEEIGSLDDIAQIVTFGQPRAVHGNLAHSLLSEALAGKYIRFVRENGAYSLRLRRGTCGGALLTWCHAQTLCRSCLSVSTSAMGARCRYERAP